MHKKLFALVIVALLLMTVPSATLAQDETAPQVISGEEIECPMPLPPEEIEGETVVCGQVTVPEDWSNPDSTPITITYARLLSTSKSPFADPILYFHGGPGGTVLGSLGTHNFDFPFLRATRDIIYFDQRGNRYSSDLRCPSEVQTPDAEASNAALAALGDYQFTQESDPVEAMNYYVEALTYLGIGNCAVYLREQGRDLAQYNTVNTVQDSIALMNYLGYPVYNLFGISYGTTVILSILDYYENTSLTDLPEIRSALIDGVFPLNEPGGFAGQFFNLATAALGRFEACEADTACAAAYPNIRQRTIDLLAKAQAAPLVLADGAEITLDDLATMLLLPVAYRNFQVFPFWPRMIAELENGDASTYQLVAALMEGNVSLAQPASAETPFDPIATEAATLAAELRLLADRLAGLSEESAALTESFTDVQNLADLYLNVLNNYLERTGADARNQFGTVVNETLVGNPEAQTRHRLRSLSASLDSPIVADELVSIVDSMTDVDVVQVFATLTDADYVQPLMTFDFITNFTVKCNDRVAYTDVAAFQEQLRTFDAPQLLGDDKGDGTPPYNLAICAVLGLSADEQTAPPPGVVSAVRTLVINGAVDTNTPVANAVLAMETLTNAELIIFSKSAHGATRFTDCARDIANAFFTYPDIEFDQSCVEELEPAWVLPEDALPAVAAQQ